MTDIDLQEETEEKKESWYAKLRASLKEKYEGQINDLENQIANLKSQNATTKKNFFERSLKQEGYEGDFTDFTTKYQDLEVDEMIALYKWMNWVIKKEETTVAAPVVEDNQLWSKSVLWTNPTEMSDNDSVDKMDGQAYLEYLKRNMDQLGLG